MNICARKGCSDEFDKNAHNQKYCSDACCKLATNSRIMEKYYENKDRKSGKTRICKSCHNTKLSRYNNSQVCAACELAREVETNQSVLSMLQSAMIA